MRIIKNTIKAVGGIAVVVLLGGIIIGAVSSQPVLVPAPIESFSNATVEHGRYLSKAGNCSSCHTEAGGMPYSGGVEFQTPFGIMYSTNITPDKASGIGSWSFNDFYRAMKQGVRPDGSHLYPAFPYTDFAKLTDEDLASLYLYFQSITPVVTQATVNELNFPFSQRALLGPWKWLFHDAETFVPDPDKSELWNRGAYLTEGPGHCGACHSPRNIFGAEKAHLAMTGGVHMSEVKLGGHRLWSAVNLTGHSTGLASWSEKDLVDYLQTGISDKAVVHGPMTKVVMGSTQHLSESDLTAIAHYLKTLPENAQKPAKSASPEELAAGEVVYTVHCGSCHLPTGKGSEGMGVSLEGNPIVQAADPASLLNVILYGPHLPPRPFSVDRSNMKMFGKRLSDEEIAHLSSYVRNSFGNQGSVVSPEQVAQQR